MKERSNFYINACISNGLSKSYFNIFNRLRRTSIGTWNVAKNIICTTIISFHAMRILESKLIRFNIVVDKKMLSTGYVKNKTDPIFLDLIRVLPAELVPHSKGSHKEVNMH